MQQQQLKMLKSSHSINAIDPVPHQSGREVKCVS
jgi:hypothetical protein